MDSYGRKTLILWSSGGMFLSCIVIVLSLLGYLNHVVALVAVNSYVAFFEVRKYHVCSCCRNVPLTRTHAFES
jgi:hypothetical protein